MYRSKAKEKPGLNVFIDDEDFSHIMYGLYENRPIVNDIVKVEGSMAMLLRLDSFWFRIRVIHRDPVLRIAKKVLLGSVSFLSAITNLTNISSLSKRAFEVS